MVVLSTTTDTSSPSEILSTEAANLPENMECVDGEFIEKTGMTFKHSVTQANLTRE
ncbi:MAG: hypothetical protein Fur006_17370 [Coleofasciculaceae cyanobacterium]